MPKPLLLAGIVAMIAAPAASQAATRCGQADQNHEIAGTVAGAVAGGLVGNAVSHGRGRTAGTAPGAVGGALIGNRLAASSADACADGYFAYDGGAAAEGYTRVQYQYQPDAARYLGPPTYEHEYGYQPYTQTPTYYYNNQTGYAHPRPGYGYEDRSYSNVPPAYGYETYNRGPRSYESYSWQTYPGYSAEQNYRERRAFAANQAEYGRSYYTNGYPPNTWQDAYGRTCYWSNGSSHGQYPNWVQTCR